jgi:hypothetical protein
MLEMSQARELADRMGLCPLRDGPTGMAVRAPDHHKRLQRFSTSEGREDAHAAPQQMLRGTTCREPEGRGREEIPILRSLRARWGDGRCGPPRPSGRSSTTSRRLSGAVREELAQIGRELAGAQGAIAFTRAGISTESGLPDYRGSGGLWQNRRLEELANLETLLREPVEFWRFYATRLAARRRAAPNPAHLALAHPWQSSSGLGSAGDRGECHRRSH